MEIGLVLLVLFLFMFVQGIILAFILIRLSDRQNTQATVEDVDFLLKEIQELKNSLIKPKAVKKPAPAKKAPAPKKQVTKKTTPKKTKK